MNWKCWAIFYASQSVTLHLCQNTEWNWLCSINNKFQKGRYLNWNQTDKTANPLAVCNSDHRLPFAHLVFVKMPANARAWNPVTFPFEATWPSVWIQHILRAGSSNMETICTHTTTKHKHNKNSDPTVCSGKLQNEWTFIGYYLNLFSPDMNTSWFFISHTGETRSVVSISKVVSNLRIILL